MSQGKIGGRRTDLRRLAAFHSKSCNFKLDSNLRLKRRGRSARHGGDQAAVAAERLTVTDAGSLGIEQPARPDEQPARAAEQPARAVE